MLLNVGSFIGDASGGKFSALGGGIALTAPVLTQNPVVTNDATPTFDCSLTSPAVDDVIQLQWSRLADFSVTAGSDSNAVDSSEAAALAVAFTIGALEDFASWRFRARHDRLISSSPWSATCTVVVETAAPTLSSPTDVKTGSSTGIGTVSTNEGQGTLYWVLTPVVTTPTAAQIRAGQDNLGAAALKSGNQAVTATGTQTVPFTALTDNTTYYAHFTQDDPSSNHSNAISGDGFTTDAAADVTPPTITSGTSANNTTGTTLAFSLTANETVTWSIVGGADQAKFEISTSTLRWTANGTQNYAAPADADANNTYIVTVRATDTSSNTTDGTITITVVQVSNAYTYYVYGF